MRVMLCHTVVNIFVFPSLCLRPSLSASHCVSFSSLSFYFCPAVSRCCSQAFILHCALFTATFSVDFLTPDFLIGIQYFRYVHYAFKCELSALFPLSLSRPPPSLIHYPFVQYALFIILRGRWPTANELLGNSIFQWKTQIEFEQAQ